VVVSVFPPTFGTEGRRSEASRVECMAHFSCRKGKRERYSGTWKSGNYIRQADLRLYLAKEEKRPLSSASSSSSHNGLVRNDS
jgi:hypothetical protein